MRRVAVDPSALAPSLTKWSHAGKWAPRSREAFHKQENPKVYSRPRCNYKLQQSTSTSTINTCSRLRTDKSTSTTLVIQITALLLYIRTHYYNSTKYCSTSSRHRRARCWPGLRCATTGTTYPVKGQAVRRYSYVTSSTCSLLAV